MKSLDLGCGANPKNPFDAKEVFGVDVRDLGDGIKRANLFLETIPFENDVFDFVTAYDFVEHLPRVLTIFDHQSSENKVIFPFINLMNEIYRVLKIGGVFLSKTPAYPHPEAFQDPTHTNIITEQTFPLYFNDQYPVAHIYGFSGGFAVMEQSWEGIYLITKLRKTHKPDLSKYQSY